METFSLLGSEDGKCFHPTLCSKVVSSNLYVHMLAALSCFRELSMLSDTVVEAVDKSMASTHVKTWLKLKEAGEVACDISLLKLSQRLQFNINKKLHAVSSTVSP